MTGREDHAHAPVRDRRPHPPARARAAHPCAAPHATPAVPPTARFGQAPRRVGAHRGRPGPRPRLRRCLIPRHAGACEKGISMADSIGAFLDEWAAAEQTGDTEWLETLLTGDFAGIGPLGFLSGRI